MKSAAFRLVLYTGMVFLSIFLPAQNQTKIDSLLKKLNTANDTLRLKIYFNLGKEFVRVKPDSAFSWFQKGISEGELLLKKKQDPAVKKSLTSVSASLNSALGNILSIKGKIPEATACYNKSIELNRACGNKKNEASVYSNLGLLLAEQGDFRTALEDFQKALTLAESTENPRLVSTCLVNIGNVYLNSMKNYTEAKSYYSKALKKLEESVDEDGKAYAFSNMGVCDNALGDTASALKNYRKSLEIRKRIEDKTGLMYSYANFGVLYLNVKKYDLAQEWFLKSYEQANEIGHSFGAADACNYIASICLEKKDMKSAQAYAEKAFAIADKNDYRFLIRDAALVLKKCYAASGNKDKALEMYEIYVAAKDSVDNMEQRKDLVKKDLEFRFAQKTAADSIRQQEAEKVHQAELEKEKTQRYALYSGIILVALFAVFIFNRLAVSRKQNRIIQEQKTLVEIQKEEVQKQKEIIEEKQKEVLDSIRYARRIQQTLITSERYIEGALKKLYKKK